MSLLQVDWKDEDIHVDEASNRTVDKKNFSFKDRLKESNHTLQRIQQSFLQKRPMQYQMKQQSLSNEKYEFNEIPHPLQLFNIGNKPPVIDE